MGAILLATGTEPGAASQQPFDPYWAMAGGKPLLVWSVAALAQTPAIDALALVVAPERVVETQELVDAEGWPMARIVASGAGLVGALRAGLAALPVACAWVVVHDAARPLLTPEVVAAGIAAARQSGPSGAAVAVEPVKETIKLVRDGVVVQTLDRSRLALVHTPQVYARASLLAALANAEPEAAAGDVATLALAAGIALATYPGGAESLKVRAPEDLALAATLLERRVLDVPERTRPRHSRDRAEKDGAL